MLSSKKRKQSFSCDDIDKLLFEYADHATDEIASAEIEKHLEGCEKCRKKSEECKRLLENISKLELEPPSELHSRVMESIKSVPQDRKKIYLGRFFTNNRIPIGTLTAACIVLAVIVGKSFSSFNLQNITAEKVAEATISETNPESPAMETADYSSEADIEENKMVFKAPENDALYFYAGGETAADELGSDVTGAEEENDTVPNKFALKGNMTVTAEAPETLSPASTNIKSITAELSSYMNLKSQNGEKLLRAELMSEFEGRAAIFCRYEDLEGLYEGRSSHIVRKYGSSALIINRDDTENFLVIEKLLRHNGCQFDILTPDNGEFESFSLILLELPDELSVKDTESQSEQSPETEISSYDTDSDD